MGSKSHYNFITGSGANRNTSDMMDLGPPGGAVAISFGVLLTILAIGGLSWWFWIQARDHPRQPRKYPLYVNIGLLTVVPTLALIALTYYTTLGDLGGPLSYYGIGGRGPISAADLIGLALAVIILLYGVFRGKIGMAAEKFPPVFALALLLASGLAMVEMGRQARGKGYNDMVNSAMLTDWEAIDDHSSLLTIKYDTDDGQECTVSVELDCDFFWQDIERSYKEQQGQDGFGDDQVYYIQGYDRHYMWDEDNYEELVSSTITYTAGDDEDHFFDCRSGMIGGNGQRALEDRYNRYGFYNYNGEWQYNDAQNDNDPGTFTVSNVLINSHTCRAGLFSATMNTFGKHPRKP